MKGIRWKNAWLAFLLIWACSGQAPMARAAEPGVSVVVNGEILRFEVSPQIIHNRTMVPVRPLLETLGAEVSWDGASRTVTARKGKDWLRLTVGSYVLYKNGQPLTMDAPVTLVQGRVMVPLRFISEALGARVAWQADGRTVKVEFPASPTPSPSSVDSAKIAVQTLDAHVSAQQIQEVQQLLQENDMAGTLSKELGLDLQQPVHLYLASDAEAYRQTMKSLQFPADELDAIVQNSNGVTYGDDIVIVLSRNQQPGLLKNVIQHELTHVVFNQNGLTEGMPSWMNEGIAWRLGLLAEEKGESPFLTDQLERGLRYTLLDALAKGEWVPLISDPAVTITENVPYNVEVQDYFAVEYLLQQYGQKGLQQYFHAIQQGSADPFRQAFGRESSELEQDFTSSLKGLAQRTDHGVRLTFRVEPTFAGYVALMGKGQQDWTRYRLPPGTYTATVYPDGRIEGLNGGERVAAPGDPVADTVFIGMKPDHTLTVNGKVVQSGGFAIQSGYGEYFLLNAWTTYTDGSSEYPFAQEQLGVTLLAVEPLS